jgi:O-antigen ligase/polysaccharide polymerase Wzy-like membrane protein
VLPTAAMLVAGVALVSYERGSIAAADWLPYAVGAALLLAVLGASGAAVRPSRAAALGLVGLAGLALWNAASVTWSPVPGLARDEALLTLFYACAFVVPVLSLRSAVDRLLASELLVAAVACTGLVTALHLRFADQPASAFVEGRLSYPISYANALAAFFLIAFWPAVLVAARRSAGLAARAFALGAAALVLGLWLATQSKGAGLGLVVSTLVFFAAPVQRLRAFVPVALAGGLAAVFATALTEPYRSAGDAAVERAGTALLLLTGTGALVGLGYALLDRRLELSEQTARLAGRAVLAALAVGVAVGAAAFLLSVGSPTAFASDQWQVFKRNENVNVETHFSDVGSNRYDYWRVAIAQFEVHPVAGVGGRGFGALYLQHRDRAETPRRAHSVELDALMELGVLGFVLLALAVGAPLIALAGKVRRPSAAAAFGGCVLWLTHATVDWIWTLPAAGLPFFVLLGIGVSEDQPRSLGGRTAAAATVASAAAAVLLFAPPWLAGRIESRAAAPGDLRWAERLDPFSADPYLAEARLTPAPANLEPYRKAGEREPRRAEVRYEYGVALVNAGRKQEARVQLEEALRLWPGQRAFAQALQTTR